MSLIKVDEEEYGVEESKAREIQALFTPMLEKMANLEAEYNDLIKQEISPATCANAKELRLEYVSVRTGTAKIHKSLKEFYLKGGRLVDGWKNAQLAASADIEKKLKDIEDHYIIIERKRIEKIADERKAELLKYDYDHEAFPANLGEMEPAVWDNYIDGVKHSYNLRKEAEEKAERERIEREKKEKLHSERRLELAKYSQFEIVKSLNFDTTDEEYESILNEAVKLNDEHLKEQERIRKENEKLRLEAEEKEKQAAKEKAEREKKEAAERARNEKKLAAERKEKERIAAELKAKEEAEEKKRQEAEEKRQAELQKGDIEKMKDMVSDLESLKTKYSFKSDEYNDFYKSIGKSIDSVVKEIKGGLI